MSQTKGLDIKALAKANGDLVKNQLDDAAKKKGEAQPKKQTSKPKAPPKRKAPSMKDIGTKRITEEERKIPKTFTVERGVYEQLAAICQDKGVTVSSAVNDLIKMYVEGSK